MDAETFMANADAAFIREAVEQTSHLETWDDQVAEYFRNGTYDQHTKEIGALLIDRIEKYAFECAEANQ